jgi:hypothetical protein
MTPLLHAHCRSFFRIIINLSCDIPSIPTHKYQKHWCGCLRGDDAPKPDHSCQNPPQSDRVQASKKPENIHPRTAESITLFISLSPETTHPIRGPIPQQRTKNGGATVEICWGELHYMTSLASQSPQEILSPQNFLTSM